MELVTALNEAASNCVMHARSHFCVYLKIQNLACSRALISIQISDFSGAFFDGNHYDPPLPGTCEGKMGVLIMRSTADEIRWVRHDRGTTVEMSKLCYLDESTADSLSNADNSDKALIFKAS